MAEIGGRIQIRWLIFSLLLIFFCGIFFTHAAVADTDIFERKRVALVDELRQAGITDERVIRVIAATPRHAFVPPSLQSLAYENHPLPIGLGQTISQPYIVAIMTEVALGRRSDTPFVKHSSGGDAVHGVADLRVLEIGTGSGYQAAVLSQLVKEVYTIEILPELARSAAARLKKLGYMNITVRAGDGYKGWPAKAPFDAIVVTAAPPHIPAELVKQLARGGRMVVPVGENLEIQNLMLIEKSDTGEISIHPMLPVRFVPMVKGDGDTE